MEALATNVDAFVDKWASAEARGDVTALRTLLDDDFVGVRRDGTVLDKPDWLGRYQTGDLVNDVFSWQTVDTRAGRDAAVVVGYLDQFSSYRGRDDSGALTVTLVALARRGRWRLIGFHASGGTVDR